MPSGALTFRTGGGTSTGSGDSVKKSISATAHGFSVGECVYYTGSAWAKAKADSSVTAESLGVVDAVADANTFSLTVEGYISTLSGLVAGSVYFLSASTAGALTTTEPTTDSQVSKPILIATSTTTAFVMQYRGLIISGSSENLAVNNSIVNGRLTLTTATPITTSDVTGATTIYFTPYMGNYISLYNGTYWTAFNFTELSLALGTLTSAKNYDVFVYNNSGTLTLELSAAWASDTTRTDAISLQDGVYVKTSTPTRRLLGTFYTTSTTTTEDSVANRYVANLYNKIQKQFLLRPGYTNNNAATTVSFTASSYTLLNSGTGSKASYVICGSSMVESTMNMVGNIAATYAGIGDDSDTTVSPGCWGANGLSATCHFRAIKTDGRHTLSMLAHSGGGAASYYVDYSRDGGTTDPYFTYLTGYMHG